MSNPFELHFLYQRSLAQYVLGHNYLLLREVNFKDQYVAGKLLLAKHVIAEQASLKKIDRLFVF